MKLQNITMNGMKNLNFQTKCELCEGLHFKTWWEKNNLNMNAVYCLCLCCFYVGKDNQLIWMAVKTSANILTMAHNMLVQYEAIIVT